MHPTALAKTALLVGAGWLLIAGSSFAVDPWTDSAAQSEQAARVSRSLPTADDYPAPADGESSMPPRPLPLRLEDNLRPAAATESVEPTVAGQQPRGYQPIPLAPQSSAAPVALGGGSLSPLATAAISLGIVLGLFLLVVTVVRRGMPKNTALLPREAVELLGHAPLVGRQQVHLVRCGNKILLLSISPNSVETLTEITDPLEVDRLAGICQQSGPHSMTSSFRHALDQFNKSAATDPYLSSAPGDELNYDSVNMPSRRRNRESHA